MLSIKNIIELTVPQYLIITILTPLAAWLMLGHSYPTFGLTLAVVSLSLAMLGFNVMNMIFDVKIDRISKPERPIPSGAVSVKEASLLVFIFYLTSTFVAFRLNVFLFALVLAFIVISFLYTNPVTYLRRYFWAPSMVGAIIYALIPFLIAFTSSEKTMNIIYPLFFASLVFFIAPSKDIEDTKGDKRANIISLPIMIGIRNTMIFIIGGVISVLICMAFLSLMDIIDKKFILPSLISIALFLILNKNYIHHMNNPELHEMIITQSKFVTTNMIAIITIQMLYGLTNILLLL